MSRHLIQTFDLQIPKLDHTMRRRVNEVKGGEAAKTEANELLHVSRPLLYLCGAIMSGDNLKYTLAAAAVSALQLWAMPSTM